LDKFDKLQNDKIFRLWVLLTQTQSAIHKARKRELARYNLTPAQAGILHSVKSLGSHATLAEVSRWVFLKPQSVHEAVAKMVADGLLSRGRNPRRKNWITIELTEKGRKALGKALRRRSIESIMSVLSEDELTQLRSLLKTLRAQAMKKIGEKQQTTGFPVKS
jgi:DNA-binding MarR family transcriptional regulator